MSEVISNASQKELEFMLRNKFPDINLIPDYSIILHYDAALQLKEKGYSAVVGIKRAGIEIAKVFEKVGFKYSEIDYSVHSRKMESPIMGKAELIKIEQERVLLTDVDFISAKTINGATSYLRDRGIDVNCAFIECESWNGIEGFKVFREDWEVNNKGLRRIKKEWSYKFPEDFEVFTFTDINYIKEAIKRVSQYFSKH